MKKRREIIGVDDRVSVGRAIPLGIQHMMSMFGSTVLVPMLTGLHPSIAIMCSGIGTICYLLITRNKIPSYLGSSFAFISPIVAVGATRGLDAALSGIVVAGLVYLVVAGVIKLIGTDWMDRILPPVLVGSVIIVIGIGLSATAVKMALYSSTTEFVPVGALIAGLTLLAAVVFSSMNGLIGTIPVLLAIIFGYVCACFAGLVDFQPVLDAAWIGLPTFTTPKFDWGAIALIAPVAFVVIIEHIGHLLVVGEIVGKDYRPMLPQSLAGDGIATVIAGLLGGAPTTTYAENIGVMSVTRVYSTQVFWYAAGFALLVGGFCPKLEAIIMTIPTPVMGGVSLLLFGLIASNGLRMLVSNKVDFSINRNLMIASVVIILGVGMETAGISLPLGDYTLPGMATSALIGIVMNLIIPKDEEETSPDDGKSVTEEPKAEVEASK
jgi:uracil permease